MEIPDDLLCLFSARIDTRDGSYVIEIPESEFALGGLDEDAVYRIAVLPASGDEGRQRPRGRQEHREPPVDVGDHREVEIENLGDQGDGIARVDRGYVVIVPGTSVGDRVTVEIEEIHANFALASVVENHDA